MSFRLLFLFRSTSRSLQHFSSITMKSPLELIMASYIPDYLFYLALSMNSDMFWYNVCSSPFSKKSSNVFYDRFYCYSLVGGRCSLNIGSFLIYSVFWLKISKILSMLSIEFEFIYDLDSKLVYIMNLIRI